MTTSNGLVVNNNVNDAGYHTIESYNKNSNNVSINNNNDASPIPVLLRSASSLLSRSMRIPAGSLRASTLTVITGMIGGGTFTFSYGVYKSGMFCGIIYLCVLASLIAYTTHAIVWCAEKNNCPSFRSLANKLYGKKVALFIQICLCLMLWMVCISYMTLTKNLLSSSISILSVSEWYTNKNLLLLIASIFPTYLALKRRVSSLRYASLFGLIIIVFSMIFVVIKFMELCPKSSDETNPGYNRKCFIDSISDDNYLFNSQLLDHSYAIALFFGGFAAQFTILPIYFEMQKRSSLRMTKCIASGFAITCFIYIIVAFFGFWTFPNLVDPKQDQNLITLYDNNDIIMLILQILLALYVMSIIPLFAHSFRKSITELVLSKSKHGDDAHNDASDDSDDSNDSDIIQDAIANPHLFYVHVSPEAKKIILQTNDNNELPILYHALLTCTFLLSVFAVAIFAQNIGQVNSIISSTILPIVGFIFPAACCLKTEGASLRMKLITCFTALISVLNAIIFFYNILH